MISKQDYSSYLVRLWRDPPASQEWVAQVEHIPSGKVRYFASIEDVFAFIRGQLRGGEGSASVEQNH
ncbi:MAG: hypothetical protein HY675_11970 [Chloroflexi bacterium]|nr:hypothetical protein [Chloroflexota bacterium]